MLGIIADLTFTIIYTDIVVILVMDLHGLCCHPQNVLIADLEVD